MPYVWRCQISYNGSGTFNINTAGQPVVTGTVISSTAFNALTADLGTGLSTAITKDGQTTATARIPFAQGINSSLVTDATSTTTGSIITAGGVGIAKALYVGTTLNVAGASTLAAITGTFNGTVGATTPSTGAFTTLNLSSTSTISGAMTFRSYNPGWIISPTVGTNSAYGQYANTGGNTYVGIDNSTGGDFGGAAGNYGFNIYRPSVGFAISRAGVVDIGITSAGAVSIPGTLTVTGLLTASANLEVGSGGNLVVGGASTYGQFIYAANASAHTHVYFSNSNGNVGTISTSGSATAYNTSSDYRLKENVQPMTGALATVAALKPVLFNWKVDGSDGQGFIAHELQEVVPGCVTGEKDAVEMQTYEISPAIPATQDEEGNELTSAVKAIMGEREVPRYQGIDTSFLVATLTAAIQEQQAIITALTTRITALENK